MGYVGLGDAGAVVGPLSGSSLYILMLLPQKNRSKKPAASFTKAQEPSNVKTNNRTRKANVPKPPRTVSDEVAPGADMTPAPDPGNSGLAPAIAIAL